MASNSGLLNVLRPLIEEIRIDFIFLTHEILQQPNRFINKQIIDSLVNSFLEHDVGRLLRPKTGLTSLRSVKDMLLQQSSSTVPACIQQKTPFSSKPTHPQQLQHDIQPEKKYMNLIQAYVRSIEEHRLHSEYSSLLVDIILSDTDAAACSEIWMTQIRKKITAVLLLGHFTSSKRERIQDIFDLWQEAYPNNPLKKVKINFKTKQCTNSNEDSPNSILDATPQLSPTELQNKSTKCKTKKKTTSDIEKNASQSCSLPIHKAPVRRRLKVSTQAESSPIKPPLIKQGTSVALSSLRQQGTLANSLVVSSSLYLSPSTPLPSQEEKVRKRMKRPRKTSFSVIEDISDNEETSQPHPPDLLNSPENSRVNHEDDDLAIDDDNEETNPENCCFFMSTIIRNAYASSDPPVAPEPIPLKKLKSNSPESYPRSPIFYSQTLTPPLRFLDQTYPQQQQQQQQQYLFSQQQQLQQQPQQFISSQSPSSQNLTCPCQFCVFEKDILACSSTTTNAVAAGAVALTTSQHLIQTNMNSTNSNGANFIANTMDCVEQHSPNYIQQSQTSLALHEMPSSPTTPSLRQQARRDSLIRSIEEADTPNIEPTQPENQATCWVSPSFSWFRPQPSQYVDTLFLMDLQHSP